MRPKSWEVWEATLFEKSCWVQVRDKVVHAISKDFKIFTGCELRFVMEEFLKNSWKFEYRGGGDL